MRREVKRSSFPDYRPVRSTRGSSEVASPGPASLRAERCLHREAAAGSESHQARVVHGTGFGEGGRRVEPT